MNFNPDLHKRLADQQIREVLCVAKLDCILRGQFTEAKKLDWSFPTGLLLLPVMLLMVPFKLGEMLLKRQWS